MSELNEKLLEIKRQKDAYIIPENIKKDITIYGVTGTLESGSGDVKLFDTVEHMQADPNPSEGDLAIVYRNEIQPLTVSTHFTKVTFPETVVLEEVIGEEDSVELNFRSVDESSWFDCWGTIDQHMFDMSCHGEQGEYRIGYTSEDGLTYTRTTLRNPDGDVSGDELDFGRELYYSYEEYWNDVIGKFMLISGNVFDGLFKYMNYLDKNKLQFIKLSDLQIESLGDYVNWNGNIDNTMVANAEKIKIIINKIYEDLDTDCNINLFLTANREVIAVGRYQMVSGHYNYTNSGILPVLSNDMSYIQDDYNSIWSSILDLDNLTYSELNYNGFTAGHYPVTDFIRYYNSNFSSKSYFCYMNGSDIVRNKNDNENVTDTYPYTYGYCFADTQLTVDNINQLLTGKTALGSNGTYTGDGSIWDLLPVEEIYSRYLGLDKTEDKQYYADSASILRIRTR